MRLELRSSFFHDDEDYIARLSSTSLSSEEAFRIVHTLKSIAFMLGLEVLSPILSEAEDALACKESEKSRVAIQRFLEAFEKAKKDFLLASGAESASLPDEAVEVLFRPQILSSIKGHRYIYHRRELIRLEGPANLDWVVLHYADQSLKALAVSEISEYSPKYPYAA